MSDSNTENLVRHLMQAWDAGHLDIVGELAVWLVAGALTWALSVAVKIVAAGGVHALTDTRVGDSVYAALQGGVSAVSELGAAALAFTVVLSGGSVGSVVAFGLGAGALEAGLLLRAAQVQTGADEASTGAAARVDGVQRYSFVVERVAALMGHVGARGLIWVGVHGPVWPVAVAVVTFAAVDGVASYGHRREWDWMAPTVWWRFNAFTLGLALVELLVFAVVV
ncbi:MAG: hypothetical protein GVY12_01480 [Bacteroidetes bacterium]|jgi:hypothetical protein|nr:hypothetical protein [Bacteroidota bacterium]